MKFIGIALVFYFQTSWGQADSTFYFKEFGWTIKLPSGFKIMDSVSEAAQRRRGIKLVDSISNQKMGSDATVNLITATKGRPVLFTANYDNSKLINRDNWQKKDSALKILLKRTYEKILNTQSDTSYSMAVIDGVQFQKFDMNLKNEKIELRVSLWTTFLKGKYLSINYFFADSSSGNQILRMINNSTFDH